MAYAEQALSARISRRAADRLRAGHLWVYRSDIEELPDQEAAGALVTILDSRGAPLGTALYSSASEIALRLISPEPNLTRPNYLAGLRSRIEAAIELRATTLAPEAFASREVTASPLSIRDAHTNACRLIFSEADSLPGIVADRYNDLVILQLLTQGTAQEDVRRIAGEIFSAQPWCRTVVERPDPRIRELEHLPPAPTEPLFTRQLLEPRKMPSSRAGQRSGEVEGPPRLPFVESGEDSLRSVFSLNGLHFNYNANAGQKTGAFLDQRLNYAAAARIAHGRALDICTYQGGFALHLARACTHVTGVDASRAALEIADRNLGLNQQLTPAVDWIEADAFELLRDFSDRAASDPTLRYDTIVLDPPAFAKSRRAASGALRGYKELNLRALKMITPGGSLVTCSCSHHISLADFTEVVRSAAADAGRRVQLLETRGAAPDHPAILTLPETSYLKCLLLRVE
ncbi:MAG TPA: class I SAM-dependent rRNA methyltransferase [Acidobacteriaceae bacterium]|nr:class I SAM-dependent rRNA methyltransferase [Acidobacteriaceae bacterium]